MENRKNPFHELYLTESISSEKFVHLFSPFLVEKALSLFEPGHVILKGLPGTGKSMLLSLLKPSIRIAYAKNKVQFPVPDGFNKFIGAGINLRRSGVSDFGQRPIEQGRGYKQSPYYFADYLNYWVIVDILDSIEKLSSPELRLADSIGINFAHDKLQTFAIELSKELCWNGYLKEIQNFNDLKNKLIERISIYKSFLIYNTDEIPAEIKSSKTAIGEPMKAAAKLLKSIGILSHETEIFVRIDQYEELAWLEDLSDSPEKEYQEMIHKLLAMRDTAVSYRIGTRHFAWNERGRIFRTSARLEKGRNYVDISIDNVLKRKENRRTWIFPHFAEDILCRRLKLSGLYDNGKSRKGVLESVFGRSGKPQEKASLYLKSNKEKAVRVDVSWPDDWKQFLIQLAQDDPFSARLGEAWSRQKGEKKKKVMHDIPDRRPFPWEKSWWKKERVEQALLHIASRNNQQPLWYGKDDILSLSGGNILAFLQLCRSIWDVWIRDTTNEQDKNLKASFIDTEIQSIGAIEASNSWYENISLEKGGKQRKMFINFLGSHFYKTLVEDLAMSNPGHNGFSLDVDVLEKKPRIKSFLNEATDYGDLYDAPHTSKLKDKKERRKWYLTPILSPHFKIPSAHTKEPIYLTIDKIEEWLNRSLGDWSFPIQASNDKGKKKNAHHQQDGSQTSLDL